LEPPPLAALKIRAPVKSNFWQVVRWEGGIARDYRNHPLVFFHYSSTPSFRAHPSIPLNSRPSIRCSLPAAIEAIVIHNRRIEGRKPFIRTFLGPLNTESRALHFACGQQADPNRRIQPILEQQSWTFRFPNGA
jgi:hypothetical protein